ncbi:MAG: redoxin domain-containing protein [Bacteroidetes bacterium]|nr:redoxin domain-containing protein [Bacteroidota bacterium]
MSWTSKYFNKATEKNSLFDFSFELLRILLGGVFVLSGTIKLFNLTNFTRDVAALEIIAPEFSLLIAIALITLELLVGLTLCFNILPFYISKLVFFIIAIFTVVVTVKYVEGANVSCGCFGELEAKQINIFTILRNIILLIWSFFLVEYYYFKKTSKSETPIDNFSSFIKSSKQFYVEVKNHLISSLKIKIAVILVLFLIVQNISLSNQNRKLKDIVSGNFVDYEGLRTGDTLKSIKVNDLSALPIELKLTESNFLIFLFKTSCEPCIENFDNWIKLSNEIKEKGIAVFAISLDSAMATKKFILEKKSNFPTYYSVDNEFKHQFKAYVTPQTVLINESGTVVENWKGILSAEQQLEIKNNFKNKSKE